MKSPPLFPLVALVFAVAYACTDSSAPVRSHSLLAPTELNGDLGKPPPPPVSTVIAVEIESPGFAVFTGVYFTNGLIHDDGLGSVETFDGTAWLRFDNKQPDLGGTVSANARFMAKDMDFSGRGTLFIQEGIGVIAYKIVSVENFTRFAGCGDPEDIPGSPCAIISFTAVVVGQVCDRETGVGCHSGRAVAFDRETCFQENKKGDLELVCREEEGSEP